MKRKTKNIIMILILVVMLGLLGLTIYFKNINTSSNNQMPEMGERMAPPDGESSEMREPPEMQQEATETTTKEDGSSSKTKKERSSGENSDRKTPPEKPDGENNEMGEPPEMTNGEMGTPPGQTASSTTPIIFYILFGIEGLIISSIIVYLIMSRMNKKTLKEVFKSTDKGIIYGLLVLILTGAITFISPLFNFNHINKDNALNQQENSNITYNSAKEITKDENITEGTFTSETADENAILINGEVSSTIENVTVTKTGDSSGGDNTSFYGTNSAILAKGGANVVIKNATIETNATGANGVFSYGGSAKTNNTSSDGTTITISDSKITTTKDNSGGIMTTGGGTTIAKNLTINTAGTSSAAIRSDRGGGTVDVDGGTYKTTGQGSPSIYSTADITVKNATLEATASEGVVIEGKNSVTLENVDLTDNNTKLNGKSTTYKNIFLYQSMSGDASEGTATFTAKNSTITTKKGDSFYVTNTTATISLENNSIKNEDSEGNFLRVQKDSWGNSGSNGGNVTLTLKKQTAEGNIVIDELSTLIIQLTSKSSYTGTINGNNTAKSIKLTLDKNSTITLTGDSYVTELEDADETYSNINFNGYKLYVNGKAINE